MISGAGVSSDTQDANCYAKQSSEEDLLKQRELFASSIDESDVVITMHHFALLSVIIFKLTSL